MDTSNVVSVKIFGQEYTISSLKSREYIMKVADYVDSKMNEIGEGGNQSASAVAVLTAINLADELFNSQKAYEDMISENFSYKEASKKYEELWQEAQKTMSSYQEQISGASGQRDALQKQFLEKDSQNKQLLEQINEAARRNEALRARVAELTEQLEQSKSAPDAQSEMIQQLENKCRDIESSFFDLQMENIHLKNELQALRK